MSPTKPISEKNGEQTPINSVDESSGEEGASDFNKGKALMKPNFAVGPEPKENGSTRLPPIKSGFATLPPVKAIWKKKTPASRFSEEQVIVLLKDLAHFWRYGRNNDWVGFHSIIKSDLSYKFSSRQVANKIRTLRREFERSRKDSFLMYSSLRNGLIFKLCKALWGYGTVIALEDVKSGGESSNESSEREQLDARENSNMSNSKDEDEDEDENHTPGKGKQVKEFISKEDFQSDFPLLYASFDKYEFPTIAKEKCVVIPREKAQELEEEWSELDADTTRLELKRIDLLKRGLEVRLPTK